MADDTPYGLAINLQNAPGSSGRVINNRSGGHWYRPFGPPRMNLTKAGRQLLIAWPNSEDVNLGRLPTFPHWIEAIKETWIGPPTTLPAGRVRFLALADTDEGPRVNAADQAGGYYQERAYGYPSTYPRPYFGYFDPGRKRLFPWGGYDGALSAAEPQARLSGSNPTTVDNYTGFFYQGADGIITDSRHPADRIFNVDWNNDADFDDTDAVRGPETGYKVMTKGESRPLISADWQDFMILFAPDGTVSIPPLKTNRKRFSNQQFVIGSSSRDKLYANGVVDTTKPWYKGGGIDPSKTYWNSYDFGNNTKEMTMGSEVAHFDRHTGAYRITFAPDSRDDRDAFADAREALASMWPMYRVEITRQGDVRVFQVQRTDDGYLATGTTWPAARTVWEQTSTADKQEVSKNCKYGWLHGLKTASGATWGHNNTEPDAVPVGTPITDRISPRMMTDKIWWFR